MDRTTRDCQHAQSMALWVGDEAQRVCMACGEVLAREKADGTMLALHRALAAVAEQAFAALARATDCKMLGLLATATDAEIVARIDELRFKPADEVDALLRSIEGVRP